MKQASSIKSCLLAVIMGSELDDIGNLARNQLVRPRSPGTAWNQPSDTDNAKVAQEIQRLYNKGLRYIFPDNS